MRPKLVGKYKYKKLLEKELTKKLKVYNLLNF
jgi:hypothetical protein